MRVRFGHWLVSVGATAGAWLLLAGLAPAPALAQTPSFQVETRLVEVAVVVRDRKTGAAVSGLTAADFVLLEEGKPQRIELFSAYQGAPVQERGAAAQAGAEPAARVFRNRREVGAEATPVVAVMIDGYNARYEDQYYAAQAAMNVIERQETAAQWGVYSLTRYGVRVIHDYSTNTESVAGRLRSLRAQGSSEEGLAGTADVIDGLTNEFARRASADVGRAEDYLRITRTLGALRDVGRHLSTLPGRKSLIWLTAGISFYSIIALAPDLWHSTVDALNDANVAVYSVDSRGIRTPGGFLAETPSRMLNLRPGLGSPRAPMQTLAAIAASTGGLSFMNNNNLARGVREALTDSQSFYRLAYRPAHGKWNGRQVSLQVKVPGRRGLELRYRTSYVARARAPLAQPARDRLLADAIVSPLEAVEVGLAARLVPGEDGAESTLRLTVDPGSVTLQEGEGRFRGRFDVRILQASAESKVLEDFTDEVNLNLAPAEAARTLGEGFHYQRRVRVRPEALMVKVAFCDHVTGRLGTLRMELPGARAEQP